MFNIFLTNIQNHNHFTTSIRKHNITNSYKTMDTIFTIFSYIFNSLFYKRRSMLWIAKFWLYVNYLLKLYDNISEK